MIRNRIVFGTKSMKNREKLFDKGAGLTLKRAINIARSYEASQAQLKAMNPAGNEGKIGVISRPKSRIYNQNMARLHRQPSNAT